MSQQGGCVFELVTQKRCDDQAYDEKACHENDTLDLRTNVTVIARDVLGGGRRGCSTINSPRGLRRAHRNRWLRLGTFDGSDGVIVSL